MEPKTLSAEVRETRGKGPARQLRMRGLIPAVYYGPGIETQKIQVSPTELAKALRGEYRRNQTFALELGGETHLALVRDLDVHPLTRDVLHADFYAVAEDRKVETTVPFQTTGRAVGVQRGGKLNKYFRRLPVRAFPQDVPADITVDVSPLETGEEVTVADLPLPEGVEVTYPASRRVVFIEYKEVVVEEPDEAAAAAPADAPS